MEHASRGARSEARVRTASAIEPDWLAELLPGNVRTERHVVFDELRERVIGRLRRTYLGVPLEEMVDTDVDPSQAAALLAEVARADPERAFSSGEAERALLARLEFLRIWLPESDVPAGDRLWDDVLVASCAGRTSLAELRRVSLVSALRRALPHHVRTLVDAEAPVEITLPSGRRAAIRYDDARAPVVAARVQEIFGLAGTPCLACGRARLVVEILAPNMRPVQRTDDLSSFWQRGYPEVRKQLRGRYPKHDWPEDPLTARPLRAREVRGRRR